MKLHLRATIATTAVAMTLSTISKFRSYFPLQEWWGDNYYACLGLTELCIGIFGVICIPLLGFALSSNLKQLFKLSPMQRVEALIVCIMIAVNLIWHIAYYSIGADKIPQTILSIGHWWDEAEFILLTIWLWQLTFTQKGVFTSLQLGKIGKICSWVCILVVILWIVGLVIITTTMNEDMLHEYNVYTIIGEIASVLIYIIMLSLLSSYYWFSKHNDDSITVRTM